jgi:opacity protein-like surface antigen
MGFGAGIGYEFSLSQNLFVELNAYFLPGGLKISGKYMDTDVNITTHGNAVLFGLLGKFKLMPDGATPYAMVGANFGYVLSMKIKTEQSGKETSDEDALKDVNRMYYGINLGAGFEYPMGGLTLVAEANYLLGLSNMAKKPDDVKDADWKSYAKPTTITLMIGIKL